jgi:hypothetical protein
MKYNVGFLILVHHVAGKTSATEGEGKCLLQLGKGKNPSGELEFIQHYKPYKERDKDGLPGQDPELTSAEKLNSNHAIGEGGLEHKGEGNRVGEDEPHAPNWEMYPTSLAGILDEMVVTRWHGLYKDTQSAGLSSPVPGLIAKFDCVRHHAFEKTSPVCQTLLISPKWELLNRAKSEIEDGTLNVDNGAFVAFFGRDALLSGFLGIVKDIGSHFQKTYFEGYDVLDDAVDVLPVGLSEYYLRFQDWDVLSSLTRNQDTVTVPAKHGQVLAAFGTFWPEFNTNPSRSSAGSLCEAHGQEGWLHCGEIPAAAWWSSISSYSFVLDPAGGGVQSTKFYEALLARAVPICTNQAAFAKLHEKGWPMVVVDSYTDVADMNLTRIYEELKPQLESIQPYLHLDGYWNYLLTAHL